MFTTQTATTRTRTQPMRTNSVPTRQTATRAPVHRPATPLPVDRADLCIDAWARRAGSANGFGDL